MPPLVATLLTKSLADFLFSCIKLTDPLKVCKTSVLAIFVLKPNPIAARKEAENHQPIKRMGTTDEIANTILFMSSDECNFMIGANIVVDGGITLRIHENDDTGAE